MTVTPEQVRYAAAAVRAAVAAGWFGSGDLAWEAMVLVAFAEREAGMKESVDHPDHYGGDNPYEAIKVIEAWDLGFCLGNTVKYIARAGKKGDRLEDLRKARWYLDREIARLEAAGRPPDGPAAPRCNQCDGEGLYPVPGSPMAACPACDGTGRS